MIGESERRNQRTELRRPSRLNIGEMGVIVTRLPGPERCAQSPDLSVIPLLRLLCHRRHSALDLARMVETRLSIVNGTKQGVDSRMTTSG